VGIELKEYQHRQAEMCKILADRDLQGVIVVSRGGFTYDRHYNVFYLTGHYQPYVYLPGNLPHWSGRAHTVLVMSASGETILCVSTPDCEKKGICADKISYSGDFNQTLADAMEELNLSAGDVGLIGFDVLPACHWRYVVDKFPGINWVEVEAELDRMKRIKSEAEKECIRSACALNRKAIDAFYQSKAQPGFSKRILSEGDMVKIDLGIVVDGYLSEFGRTYVIREASEEQRRLMDTVHGALGNVIDFIKPGVSAQEMVEYGDSILASLGVTTAKKGTPGQITGSYPVLWGHGLGLGFERPWLISGEELTIEEGMFLAVEKFLSLENIGTAAAEQNLLVGADGVEVLTNSKEGLWL
jgi:Xaa-Pro aminopeptidase